jgi:hypothetical protein
MTTRHRVGPILLALIALTALPVRLDAQTVEDPSTNCCTEVYRVGWELGQLRSIASYETAAYARAAGRHMEQLSSTLQSANETCCRFCEAWAGWREIQNGIRATAKELLDSPESEAVEARRAFRDWIESRPADLIEGLSRCDLEEGMPCKWLGLVECARAYFQLGVELGHAAHALSAAKEGVDGGLEPILSARQQGLRSLERAANLLASLRVAAEASEPSGRTMHCDYLWDLEIGVEALLSEAVRRPDLHADEQLATAAAKADRRVVDLLIHGRPDLGVPPCPIGGEHRHEDCEREKEAGP